MEFPKNHPGLIFFTLSLALGEYWSFMLAPAPITTTDWAITIFLGVCMMMLSIFPVGLAMVLLYSLFGWWD